MRQSFTRLLAFATIALLLAAAFLFLMSLRGDSGTGGPVALVENRVQKALALAQTDKAELTTAYQAGMVLSQPLYQHIQSSSFLFKRGKLLFWSDHHVLPDPDLVQPTPLSKVTETRTGKYLLVRSPIYPDGVLLQYIPLEQSYAVRNAYFSSGLDEKIFRGISATILTDSTTADPDVRTETGRYLFSLRNAAFNGSGPLQTGAVLCLLGAGMGIILLLQFSAVRHYKRRQWLLGLLTGIGLPVLLRVVALWFNFPAGMAELGFFDPRVFAASVWSQSVGDLLITLFLAFLITAHAWYLLSGPFQARILGPEIRFAFLRTFGLFALYAGLVYLVYQAYKLILTNSLVELDVTQSLEVSINRAGLVLAMVLITAIYFLLAQLIMQRLLPLLDLWPLRALVVLGVFLAVSCLALAFAGLPDLAVVMAAGLCYPIFVLSQPFRKSQKSQPFHVYLKLFTVGAISAAIGATAFFMHQHARDIHQKQQLATNLLLKNDLLGEYLLHEAGQKIAQDPMIRRQLLNPIVSGGLIWQKITRQYIGSHFNSYDPRVLVFSATGNAVAAPDTALTLNQYKQSQASGTEKTNYDGLYLKTSQASRQTRTYIQFIPVMEDSSLLATIVLELSLKKMPSHSVLPRLLVDQRFAQPDLTEGYSFAIYQRGQLQTTGGDFDYRALFGSTDPMPEGASRNIIIRNGYSHLEVSSTDGVTVIVSSKAYLLANSLANFSFLLLVYTAAIIVVVLAYALARPRLRIRLWSSLSAKIQVLLSLGVLVPLALISLAIINQITKAYKDDIKATYREKGELIQERLSAFTQADSLRAPKEQMAELISELAQLSDAEVHLFDKNGNLLLASQPLLFETGLLAKLINPEAYHELAFQGRQRLLLTEQAGAWSFNVLYLALRSETGQVSGFLALPFFDSEQELDARVNNLVSTVMSIFTLIFLVSGFLTFLASRAVVVPLQMLTEKIRRVTLSKKNEPIQYTADDELGLLVNEYNVMLQKLEESKRELALKEKEQAWREMARQVAHEIKNPLTPMKLSMQYLQHALASARKEDVQELVDRTSNTIITQIDVLSDIATSFSHFTNLPEPKQEEVSLSSVILRTADLHNDPARSTVITDLPVYDLVVIGDEDLLVRIFNNLVLNALQAIPNNRKAQIKLRAIHLAEQEVLVEVQDNGNGIPEELREKVFVPNFSTKYAGSGIGLAVAKKGIEQMGGRIWFTTSLGTGTTFYIQLPLAD